MSLLSTHEVILQVDAVIVTIVGMDGGGHMFDKPIFSPLLGHGPFFPKAPR